MSLRLQQSLEAYARRLLPRMLTQVCRDPGSACYGCFDRNWWHYKIRDFPSVILQQGGYAIWSAADAGLLPAQTRQIAAGACRFWNARAVRWGAFEEYYPWEQGYPPLAFSTLAIAKLVAAGAVGLSDVRPGMQVAARQLTTRFEGQAANQQVAGLAATAWVAKVAPDLIAMADLKRMQAQTLKLQTEEGWFVEYGGPDLGYLAVTMDCLWDLYDATGDDAFIAAAARALRFIHPFTALPSAGAGMHNARNTDYIVPYGISRFLKRGGEEAAMAAYILERSWGSLETPHHFAHAIDDRYWCHYIGHSLLRAIPLLDELPKGQAPDSNYVHMQKSAHVITTMGQTQIAISLRKGGIFHAWCENARLADFGWRVRQGGRDYVTHWWGDGWTSEVTSNGATVTGNAPSHRETLASPWTHMALRGISLIAGRRIIALLKGRMIFKRDDGGIKFSRTLKWSDGIIEVMDTFEGLAADSVPVRAPRSSVRHVASADSYHAEDLMPTSGWQISENFARSGGTCTISTVYTVELGATL